jgi:hypothetical protein
MTKDIHPYEVVADEGIPVQMPSGAIAYVMTNDEEAYLIDRITRYQSDNHFVNVSDVQDIDKMIYFELFIHRWSLWMSKGRDYWGMDVNVRQLSDMVKDLSTEVRQLKKALGVDKSTRDRTRGDDSVAALWANVLQRAKEFGVMRNEQFVAVITAFQNLKAILIFHDNADEIERKENGCEIEDVITVLRNEIRKFDEIDEAFRHDKQRLWVRSQ